MNVVELWEEYPDNKSCLAKVLELRKLSCCSKLKRVKGRKSFVCSCGKQTYPLKGTIFENTKIPLKYWFYAIFVMANTRSGISAKTLQRELGVTYKTAWRMCHKIRELMKTEGKLKGIVETDETYVGGKSSNRAEYFFGRYPIKEVVVGMVERNGRAKLVHVDKNKYDKYVALNVIGKNVEPDSKVYSDGGYAFDLIGKIYNHKTVNHSIQFRNGDVYTQNIENVWSHLKRGINAIYRQVSPKYI